MSGCGTRIVLRGQKPLALCDRCPCFGSLFPPLAALIFAASSIICAFGLASAAPRSPYRHLELCGIALNKVQNGTRHKFLSLCRVYFARTLFLPAITCLFGMDVGKLIRLMQEKTLGCGKWKGVKRIVETNDSAAAGSGFCLRGGTPGNGGTGHAGNRSPARPHRMGRRSTGCDRSRRSTGVSAG